MMLIIVERKCEREDAKRICKSTIISWSCSERERESILGIVVSLVVVESRERGSFLLYHTKRERERERGVPDWPQNHVVLSPTRLVTYTHRNDDTTRATQWASVYSTQSYTLRT